MVGARGPNQASSRSKPDPTPEPVFSQVDTKSHFTAVERLIEDESVLLHHLLAMVPKVANSFHDTRLLVPQVPGLVSPGMLKEGKDGGQRLNGTMRKKMGENWGMLVLQWI